MYFITITPCVSILRLLWLRLSSVNITFDAQSSEYTATSSLIRKCTDAAETSSSKVFVSHVNCNNTNNNNHLFYIALLKAPEVALQSPEIVH